MCLLKSLVILIVISCVTCLHAGEENGGHPGDEWMVRIMGGRQVAELIALEMGYDFGGELPNFEDTYVFIKREHDVFKRSSNSITERSLSENEKVQWAERQFSKERQKRGHQTNPITTNARRNNILFNMRNKSEQTLYRYKRGDSSETGGPVFNDELWSQEWYMQDTRTKSDLPKLDLNVMPVYEMGFTGKNVRVTILDDGIEYTHDDLKDNYDPDISYDMNGNDSDPLPAYDPQLKNAHGTRCAGEVAMVANNKKCGVGIAYNAKIGGIKLLDGTVNDRIEGSALGYAYDKVDIYSASWGPSDNGLTVEGPGRLAQEALERGVTKGRSGKGAIFVWASGNGGIHGDNCNCDGYVGSIYTVSIGSASQKGAFPWYGERCASILGVTYSSGAYEDQMITTTDLNNGCTIRHTGTSASAPLAAGIIALALEANPNLTWRDVQHLIVSTSDYGPLAENPGWIINGAGLRFNVGFGYGLMNAHTLVKSAQNFTTVPPKSICEQAAIENANTTISPGRPFSAKFYSTGCHNTTNEVNYLEHVEIKVNILYTYRGALGVHLTSPRGTRIPVLTPRKLDRSPMGFVNWRFMSVATWGEPARGTWIVEIEDQAGLGDDFGLIGPLTFIFHGTKDMPVHAKGRDINESSEDNQTIDNEIQDEPRVYLQEVWRQFYPMEPILKEEPFDVNEEERILQRVHHQNLRTGEHYLNYESI